MRTTVIRIIAVGSLLSMSMAISAHHGFSAEYSISAQVSFRGEVTSVEWTNPHVLIFVLEKDANGTAQEWRVEGGTIKVLTQNGWTAEMLRQLVTSKIPVTITGYRARKKQSTDGSHVNGAWAKTVELPDGRSLAFN